MARCFFEATEEAGPFLVQFPNKVADVLNAGTFAEIKWDVAGTNTGKVNCQKVNILLSTNRGISYDHVLVENTDNDGSQSVTIPNILTDRARIKVEAVDNIFFDILIEIFLLSRQLPKVFLLRPLFKRSKFVYRIPLR